MPDVLDALDLQAVELYGCLAAEHVDQYLQLTLLGINLVHGTIKALERTIGNADHLTNGEVDLVFGLFNAHALVDLFDLIVGKRRRFGAGADEAGDGRRIAHDVPSVFAHFHLYEYIALEDSFFYHTALTVFDLDHFLFRHQDLEDLVFHIQRTCALADAFSYFFFVAAVGMDSIPVFL